MSGVSRADRAIALLVLAVLLALTGFALAQGGVTASPSLAPSPGTPLAAPSAAAPAASTQPGGPAAAPTTSTPTTSTQPSAEPGPVTAVGDSIMLDIQPYLQSDVADVHVDGLVDRQFDAGIQVVAAARAAGTLGNVVVVELGSNGTVTPAEFDAMVQAASGASRIVFVNVNVPRAWTAPDNAVLAAGVAAHPGLTVLADWHSLSAGHPEWFTADQVHLDPAGAAALAGLVARDV
jgi:hypothetical protein